MQVITEGPLLSDSLRLGIGFEVYQWINMLKFQYT